MGLLFIDLLIYWFTYCLSYATLLSAASQHCHRQFGSLVNHNCSSATLLIPEGNALNGICHYSSMSVPLMGPCMLDDGLDPPHMDTSPLPSAKLGLVGAKWEQSPSLFSGRYTESCFCCFIMCSHHRGCQRVKNLCESDGPGTAFSFFFFSTNHESHLLVFWLHRQLISNVKYFQ